MKLTLFIQERSLGSTRGSSLFTGYWPQEDGDMWNTGQARQQIIWNNCDAIYTSSSPTSSKLPHTLLATLLKQTRRVEGTYCITMTIITVLETSPPKGGTKLTLVMFASSSAVQVPESSFLWILFLFFWHTCWFHCQNYPCFNPCSGIHLGKTLLQLFQIHKGVRK